MSTPHQFALVMVIFGGLLVLIPEFFYLRDLFSTRMNTVFKFYYQAWMLWALAAAYGSAVVFLSPGRKVSRYLVTGVFVVTLFVGLAYPVMAVNTKVGNFLAGPDNQLTLDGTDNFYYLNPDEHAAVDWLRSVPVGTLAEAVHPISGSYSSYARISMNSGQPAVLGWIGHEHQWRGSYEEIGARQADIERLYVTTSWEEADGLIEKYEIVYIVVGNLERTTYNLAEEKFIANLTPVFQQGSVTIYQTTLLEN